MFKIVVTDMKDPMCYTKQLTLEVLPHGKHNKTHDMICYYFIDAEYARKIEVTLYHNLADNTWGSEVYYFKTAEDTKHYRSRNYPNFIGMPSKYYDIVKYIHVVFLKIFNN